MASLLKLEGGFFLCERREGVREGVRVRECVRGGECVRGVRAQDK